VVALRCGGEGSGQEARTVCLVEVQYAENECCYKSALVDLSNSTP